MSLTEQRNRFLSFAFAAADVLVETDLQGRVIYTAGAVAVLGDPRPDLTGDALAERLDPTSRPLIRALIRVIKPGRRCGPARITIDGREAKLAGWVLPDDDRIRWTIGFDAADSPEEMEPEAFQRAAEDTIAAARESGANLMMTAMKVEGLEELEHQIGPQRAAHFEKALQALTEDFVGDGVSRRVSLQRFALIHPEEGDLQALREEVRNIAAANKLRGVDVSFHSLDDSGDLDPDVAVEAFIYAVNAAADSNEALDISSLKEAASAMLEETKRKINELRTTISGRVIEPYAQAIHDLETGALSHYELLARLPDGRSLEDSVTLAERTGLIYELDYTMTQIAISFLSADPDRPGLAVNLSGRSVSNPNFATKFMKMLADAKIERHRLIFELTETSSAKDVQTANSFLQKLRKRGHKVYNDDFGAGAAGFHYLRDFDVDTVKIDGRYVKAANSRDRDSVILKSMINLSKELGCKTVCEMVETQEQAVALRALGADYGQGYLFGKPLPLKKLADPRRAKRVA